MSKLLSRVWFPSNYSIICANEASQNSIQIGIASASLGDRPCCASMTVSPLFNIDSGVDQGCPPSMVGFLFYSADMLDIPNGKNREKGFRFIDDVCFVAHGPSFPVSNSKIKKMMECRGGGTEWSRSHHVNFEMDKNTLVQCSQRQEKRANSQKTSPVKHVPITIDGHVTKPVKSHKFLGIIIDKELHFKEQLANAVAKGTKYALTCCCLTTPSLGVKSRFNRLLLNSIIIPKMLYGIDIWGMRMVAELGKRAGRKGQGRVVKRVLRTHTITASGAMRTTATDAAVAHADLTPMLFMLQKVCHQAYLCMTTLPPSNPIHREVCLAACQCKRHKSPLHLVKAFGTHPKVTEEILPL